MKITPTVRHGIHAAILVSFAPCILGLSCAQFPGSGTLLSQQLPADKPLFH